MNSMILFVLAAVALAAGKPVTESTTSSSTTVLSEDRNDLPSDLSYDDHLLPEADADVLVDLEDLPDEDLGDYEVLEGAEAVVFRPLFVHRKREASRRVVRAAETNHIRQTRQTRYQTGTRRQGPYQSYRPYRPFRPRPAYLRPIRDEKPPLQIIF